jgi:hypothetical protein
MEFIVFLEVADEDIILISWNEACHNTSSLSQSYESVGCKSNKKSGRSQNYE